MANLTIKVDPEKMLYVDAMLAEIPKKIHVAERDALNVSMGHGKTVAATDLAKEMTARKGDIMKRLTLLKAKTDRLSVALIVRGTIGVNLIAFKATQDKAGVKATIFGEKQTFAHAFITRGIGAISPFNLGATGSKFVAMREGDKRKMTKGRYANRIITRGPRAGQPLLRQPLQAQRGPTVADTWEKTPGVAEHTVNEVNGAIPKNLDNQISRFLKG